MTTEQLTPRQIREREFHDKQFGEGWEGKINLDMFADQKQYGPWNPYWQCFDFVKSRYRDRKQKLLSFGCGSGAEAIRFARMGYEVYAFDISPRCVERAQSFAEDYQLSDRTHFSVQTAENIDYPDSYFDIVTGDDILHHVEIDQAIGQVHRVLKPGGAAVFHDSLRTPMRDSIRKSPPVRWLIPIGTLDMQKGKKYEGTEDERPLSTHDIAIIRAQFPSLIVTRFRVLALASVVFSHRRFLEKCDHVMFKILPFMRWFGDEIVLSMVKN